MKRVNLHETYFPDKELHNVAIHQQRLWARVIKETFKILDDIKSFIDIGCRDGSLLMHMNSYYPLLNIAGIDYFEWMKDACSKNVKPFYELWDLRDSLVDTEWLNVVKRNNYFDIVNCTEVGEHIDKDYADIFLSNLFNLTNKYLIITWSSSEDGGHQHLNPLSIEDFENLMIKNNFVKNVSKTELIYKNAKKEFDRIQGLYTETHTPTREEVKDLMNEFSPVGLQSYPVNAVTHIMDNYTEEQRRAVCRMLTDVAVPSWYLKGGLSVWGKGKVI